MAELNPWRAIPFAILLLITAYVVGRSLYDLYKLLRRSKADPERGEDLATRFGVMLKGVFGQSKVLRNPAGLGHFIIFYGFIMITIVAMEVFVREFFPTFSLSFLGVGYDLLLFLEDFLSIGVLLALGVALFRRIVWKPLRLEGGGKGLKFDMYLIIYAVGLHIIFGNVLESLEIAEGIHPWQLDRPDANIGPFVAVWLADFWGMGDLTIITNVFWWLHAASVWVFLIYIVGTQTRVPQFFPSKHFHIIASPFNVAFSNLGPSGRLQKIDFEDETLEEYGVSRVEDFTWSQTLDLYSCTGCGRCQELCPAYLNGQPLSPKSLILDLREHALEKATLWSKDPEAELEQQMIGEVISHETLWACTTCNACQTACPLFIEHIDKIIDMRRDLVMMQSEFPKGLDKMFNNLEVNSNPWGVGKSNRDLWAAELGVKHMKDHPDTRTLFWVGCAGSFDERAKQVSTALVKILNAADIDFAILGKEEKCNGDPARRLGNEYLAQELIMENVATLDSYGFNVKSEEEQFDPIKGYEIRMQNIQLQTNYEVKEIITFCPHCYNTLANEFPDFGGHYKVIHATEFVAMLLRQGKLKVDKMKPLNLTYHDSCYLGRHNGLYTPPREILAMVGIDVKEMSMSKDKALCCGAGGARTFYELEIPDDQIKDNTQDINKMRVEMAANTGAEYMGVSCPFCTIMLEDGIKNMGTELQVLDLIEIVADRVIPIKRVSAKPSA